MNSSTPCKFCGCSQTNLIDGFYYCAECGTQDTNVRETVVEYVVFGDGDVAKASRKSLKATPKAEVQMPEDWYKWHTLNFLLKGLADEIIAAGAQPSFKTKLLWIWTRYMDKYQNKADFGITVTEDTINNEEQENDKASKLSDDEDDEDEPQKIWSTYKTDIKQISMPLIISLLYVALNLDKSHIQLGHLLRLMKQEKVSIMGWIKLIPKEFRPKQLKKTLLYNFQRFIFTCDAVRILSVKLFRELDLGNPIVPDLRLLVDDYIQELCLPNDMKIFVISLLHARSFDYLDVNVQYKDIYKLPAYEIYVMAHIIMALKICFGLDSEYENTLSDVVDKINDQENYAKSNINRKSESMDRLFCFRDWCNYIRFRKTMLWTHTLYLGAPNIIDMNDYVLMGHLGEKPDHNVTFKDEITADILKKIPDTELNIIPSTEFVTTLTPHTSYTKVIVDHIQDPEVKILLSEDFTQYSLKYITEDWFLVDPDSCNPVNILKGVNKHNKVETHRKFLIKDPYIKSDKNKTKVYVKDCDNHNWMVTQRPDLEHITNNGDEKENEQSNSKDISVESSNITLDDTKEINESKIQDISMISVDNNMNVQTENKNDEKLCEDIKILKIREEDEGVNIFDDDFIDLYVKEEIEEPAPVEPEPNLDNVEAQDLRYCDYMNDALEVNSDASSEDSLHMNPDSLNREEAIKELILHACHKYKITIPGIYTNRVVRARDLSRKPAVRPVKHHGLGEVKKKIQGFMDEYLNHQENDLFYQMASHVQSAIADFNRTKDEIQDDEPPPSEVGLDRDQTLNDSQLDKTVQESVNDTINASVNETIKEDEYKLFSDESDGETHAEELLPKKNPEFDEETHDITQLYIKPEENAGVPEMELNPRLFKIVESKIKQEIDDPKSLEVVKKDTSDSEEELPINLLLEQKRLRKQLTDQKRMNASLEPLIENNDIRSCSYWIKQYILGEKGRDRTFAEELDRSFPKSFIFVLKECADVAGYEPLMLYHALLDIEQFLTCYNSKKRPTAEFQKTTLRAAKKRRTQ